MSPFDHARGINEKQYNYEDVDKKAYSSYIVNKVLSFFPDTIFLANEINQYDVEPKQHYDFLYHSVPKKKRFSKWVKSKKDEHVEMLCELYHIRHERALEIVSVLSEEELEKIKIDNDMGG